MAEAIISHQRLANVDLSALRTGAKVGWLKVTRRKEGGLVLRSNPALALGCGALGLVPLATALLMAGAMLHDVWSEKELSSRAPHAVMAGMRRVLKRPYGGWSVWVPRPRRLRAGGPAPEAWPAALAR